MKSSSCCLIACSSSTRIASMVETEQRPNTSLMLSITGFEPAIQTSSHSQLEQCSWCCASWYFSGSRRIKTATTQQDGFPFSQVKILSFFSSSWYGLSLGLLPTSMYLGLSASTTLLYLKLTRITSWSTTNWQGSAWSYFAFGVYSWRSASWWLISMWLPQLSYRYAPSVCSLRLRLYAFARCIASTCVQGNKSQKRYGTSLSHHLALCDSGISSWPMSSHRWSLPCNLLESSIVSTSALNKIGKFPPK